MTETVTIGPWTLDVDLEATRRAYAATPEGAGCDCAYFRNWEALGEAAYPDALHEVFRRLGIDSRKPAEVYDMGRDATGLRLSGGWYHLVGTIVSAPGGRGPDTRLPLGKGTEI